jgi:methyl-accepting chemotaxis protein
VAVGLFAADNAQFFLSMARGLRADPVEAVERAVKQLPQHVGEYPYLSALLLNDGLSGRGEEAVLSAALAFGRDIKIIGGSSGDMKMAGTPVFYNDQVLDDAIVMCLLATQHPLITSVNHGHIPLSPKLRATKVVDNRLYTIDGRPAWQVWQEHVKDAAAQLGMDVSALQDRAQHFNLLARFELGLATEEGQYKVRAPLEINEDGSLNFACSIAEGAVFRIMESPKSMQIESARQAAKLAIEQNKSQGIAAALVFDCACRRIILGDDFTKGVEAVKSELVNLPMIGFETFGEICMDYGQFSGYHNTSTVITLIPE